MDALPLYTSVSCNRTPAAADWSAGSNLIAFGACNSVAIFNPTDKRITSTFIGHTDRVNSVKWIPNPSGKAETELISCSNDGNVIYWNTDSPDKPIILKEHSGSVTSVDALYVNNVLTVVSASGDSTIKIWERKDVSGQFELIQTIDLKYGIGLIVRLVGVPNTDNNMLLYSTDDDKVILMSDKEINGVRQFHPVNQLKGHEDWVRGIDVIADKDDLLIATSSQDTFIRLWRISPRSEKEQTFKKFSELEIGESIQVQETRFGITSNNGPEKIFAVALESVLQAHEAWVYSVHWNRRDTGDLQLLSASIDKTIIVWRYDKEVGVWMENARLGEVGGNSLGFFGAKFNRNGDSVFGHGFQGSFHIWSNESESSWKPCVIIGGHFNSVKDMCWEPKGRFLYSVSTDQTTRIHAPWNKTEDVTWHEMARPQVHGYDMQCITSLTRFQFASGAEEKIIRTFQAPANFIENIRGLSDPLEDEEAVEIVKSDTSGAAVPSLGLSNKSVSKSAAEAPAEKRHIKDEYPENYFVPMHLSEPPTEETLMQNTLWPENQKLYGHGYEVYSICATSDGRYLASACKATSEEHARIILWDTASWKQIDSLASHNLTVTQMRFSPNDQFLLSVSRDRRFSVFERIEKENGHVSYQLKAASDKTNGIHQRIIWSCDWSKDNKYFATSSREGKVVAWYMGEEQDPKSSLGCVKPKDVLEVKGESITAVAFAHHQSSSAYLVALGCESGLLLICRLNEKWEICHRINPRFGHHLTVQRLMFRPNDKENILASCGDDHIVRVYKIIVN